MPKKSRAAPERRASHCIAVTIGISFAPEAFSVERFGEVFVGKRDLTITSGKRLTGPLRLKARGREEFSVSGMLTYHDHGKRSHYFSAILARRLPKPAAPPEDAPRLSLFLAALSEASGERGAVQVIAQGEHKYSRDVWRGSTMELPVPLPRSGSAAGPAQLTGFEVSFEGPHGKEVVALSVVESDLMARTTFSRQHELNEELLMDTVESSEKLALQLLQEATEQE